jgi:uncharacterized membrane protein YhaH (DUF805 family)
MPFIRALFSFTGRISRVEYAVCLFVYIAAIALFMVSESFWRTLGYAGALLLLPYISVMMWIFFASLAKRFHDFGKTGWMCLACFIPLVGPFTLLIVLFYAGDEADNIYGSPVKGFFG